MTRIPSPPSSTARPWPPTPCSSADCVRRAGDHPDSGHPRCATAAAADLGLLGSFQPLVPRHMRLEVDERVNARVKCKRRWTKPNWCAWWNSCAPTAPSRGHLLSQCLRERRQRAARRGVVAASGPRPSCAAPPACCPRSRSSAPPPPPCSTPASADNRPLPARRRKEAGGAGLHRAAFHRAEQRRHFFHRRDAREAGHHHPVRPERRA